MTNYLRFQVALDRLRRQHLNLGSANERPELTLLDIEGLRESVIQRFETCYDVAWKSLKRYLTSELGLPDVQNSPKPILRLADQNGLLAGRVGAWLEYANARTATAHDYSFEKAEAVLRIVPQFLDDAQALFDTLNVTPSH